MKHSIKAITAVVFGLFTATILADDQKNISVWVNKLDDSDAKVEIKINGNAESFTLPQLSDGESTQLTTNSGKTFTASQADGSITVLTDTGETILLPAADNNQMIARIKALHSQGLPPATNQLRIIGSDLTDAQKEAIKMAIAAAGIDKKVEFSNGNIVFFPKTKIMLADSSGDSQLIEQELEWTSADGKQVKKIVVNTTGFGINFEDPSSFADIMDTNSNRKHSEERLKNYFTEFLTEEFKTLTEKGQVLSITFTDVDRAGDFYHNYNGDGRDMRVVRDNPIVRLAFRYSLVDVNGNTLKSGEENLTKIYSNTSFNARKRNDQAYYFEMKLLKEWLDSL